MQRLAIPRLAGYITATPTPKTWDGERSTDREGRPLSTLTVLIGEEAARVSIPTKATPDDLAHLTPVELVDVVVGAGKSGLWLSASSVEVAS
jgi:hypothetical protein